MGTRDDFAFGQMNHPSSYTSQHYLSEYPPVVDNSVLATYYENYGFVYEQPPPAPFLAAPPALTTSPPSSAPKFRAIQPRPNNDSKTERIGDMLYSKPQRRWRGRQSRRLPQQRGSKPKSTQCEADANMLPSTTPGRESSAPFNRYTESDLRSSSQEPTFAPGSIPPTNDPVIPERNQSSPIPSDLSEALAYGRPADHHGIHGSHVLPDKQARWPNSYFERGQSQDATQIICDELAARLEKTQVLQSLSILQDYMAKHPSSFEKQAPETVQR